MGPNSERGICKKLINTECGGKCEPISADPSIVTYITKRLFFWKCPRCNTENELLCDGERTDYCELCDKCVSLHHEVSHHEELKEIKCCDKEW